MKRAERRNTQRAPLGVDVVEEHLSERQQATAIDICEHGMLYHKPLGSKSSSNKEVFLTFSIIDRLAPIKVLGWVVDEIETKQYIETRVTFMFLPQKDEDLIRDFVSTHTKN